MSKGAQGTECSVQLGTALLVGRACGCPGEREARTTSPRGDSTFLWNVSDSAGSEQSSDKGPLVFSMGALAAVGD